MKHFLTALCVVSIVLLWLSAASVYVPPTWCQWATLAGLAFPIMLVATLSLGLLMLLFCPRRVWLPLIGLIACGGSICTYFPVHLAFKAPEGALKVMSYNCQAFGGSDGRSDMLHYLAFSGCDIICLQEASLRAPLYKEEVAPALRARTPHWATGPSGCNHLFTASRYPIAKTEDILRRDTGNSAFAAWIALPSRDTLVVVNCHLASNRFSDSERTEFGDIVHQGEGKGHRAEAAHIKHLMRKISLSSPERGRQADTIADYVARLMPRHKVIVCGDLNSTPISYPRYRIVSTGLVDAYRATGAGLGRSYHENAMPVRIDYIFASPALKPCNTHIDPTPGWSDHYPIVSYFTR